MGDPADAGQHILKRVPILVMKHNVVGSDELQIVAFGLGECELKASAVVPVFKF